MDKAVAERLFYHALDVEEKLGLLDKELDNIEDKEEKREYATSLAGLLSSINLDFLHAIPYGNPELRPIANKILEERKKAVVEKRGQPKK